MSKTNNSYFKEVKLHIDGLLHPFVDRFPTPTHERMPHAAWLHR